MFSAAISSGPRMVHCRLNSCAIVLAASARAAGGRSLPGVVDEVADEVLGTANCDALAYASGNLSEFRRVGFDEGNGIELFFAVVR